MGELLRLDGRSVVVSGAGGGGIGTTVTRMAAQAGATVVAVSRSKENLDEHVAPLAAHGLPVVPVAADASTDDGIATVIDHVRRVDGDLVLVLARVDRFGSRVDAAVRARAHGHVRHPPTRPGAR